MVIVFLGILGIVTVVCIIGAVQEFKEKDNLGMRIYTVLGILAGLTMVVGGLISYFTHWF